MRNLQDVLEAGGLDLTGWQLRSANGVSDDGTVIVGYARNPDGYNEAYMAIIPIPSAMFLFGSGLIALLGLKRNRSAPEFH